MLGLYALHQHRQTERPPKRHNRLDDYAPVGGTTERSDKAFVDLEFVERKALEVAKIGIAGAKIVERDTHAQVVEVLDALDHLIRVVDEHAFGDFKNQPGGRDRTFRQRRTNHIDNGAITDLQWRQTDCHVEVVRPAYRFVQSFTQHESTDRIH